jgi:hypothetical protein
MEGQNKSQTKALLRRRKGWPGFVRDYKKFIDTVDWDKIKWDGGDKLPKSVTTDAMGKKTYTY